jgi:general secretion pathway protein D
MKKILILFFLACCSYAGHAQNNVIDEIGGMIREEEQKTVSKIPVLGDLPGIGMIFRNTSSTKEKQELVIMLTPRIIKDSEDVVSKPDVTL